MNSAILKLAATTMIPLLELRASIPLGLLAMREDARATLGIFGVVATCIAANIILGMVVFEAMFLVEHFLLRLSWFEKRIWPRIEDRRERLRPLVDKYGMWGVSMFIGVPLPGTGACAGAMASYLLKLDRRRFWLANAVGVVFAGLAVTLVCLAIDSGFLAEDSILRKIFIK